MVANYELFLKKRNNTSKGRIHKQLKVKSITFVLEILFMAQISTPLFYIVWKKKKIHIVGTIPIAYAMSNIPI